MGFGYKKIADLDLTVFTVEGPVTMEVWIHTIEEYIRSGETRLELYDVREGNGDFHTSNIRHLHYDTKPEASLRTTDAKSAILVARPAQYGLARAYKSYAEAGGVPWEVEIFYSAEKAAEWLGVDLKGLISEM